MVQEAAVVILLILSAFVLTPQEGEEATITGVSPVWGGHELDAEDTLLVTSPSVRRLEPALLSCRVATAQVRVLITCGSVTGYYKSTLHYIVL